MAQENAILSANTELWEKVFMAADKGMTMQEDGKNYGDFLLKTIDGIKDQFSADELKLLNKGAEEIQEIEVNAPVKMGDVIKENLAGSGVELVACKTVK